MNDYDVRIVKVKGEFVWHKHDDTDDFFLVLQGHLTIQLRDGDLELEDRTFAGSPTTTRHDYTAEEFGQWAKSAQYWFDHHNFGGLVLPRRRRVFVRRTDNGERRHPLLVWIDVRAVAPAPAQR